VEGGRVQEALELADRGVGRYPDDPHMLDTRGALLEAADRLSEAERDLQRCVEVAAQMPATRANALFRLGRVQVKLGESADAKQSLSQALEIDRQHGVFTPDQRDEIQQLISATST
jgi:tetratricopeptide (TPR) repeat protein